MLNKKFISCDIDSIKDFLYTKLHYLGNTDTLNKNPLLQFNLDL